VWCLSLSIQQGAESWELGARIWELTLFQLTIAFLLGEWLLFLYLAPLPVAASWNFPQVAHNERHAAYD